MGLARTPVQLEWDAGSITDSIASSSGYDETDPAIISENAISASVQIRAFNEGTAASGDTLTVKVLYTNGDPDANPDSGDEYDSPLNAATVLVLDTYTENPALGTIRLKTAPTAFKIYVMNNGASAITASAQYTEQTASDPS